MYNIPFKKMFEIAHFYCNNNNSYNNNINYKMQKNSEYRICGDRDETISHMINKSSKLTKKSTKLETTW